MAKEAADPPTGQPSKNSSQARITFKGNISGEVSQV